MKFKLIQRDIQVGEYPVFLNTQMVLFNCINGFDGQFHSKKSPFET